jgi:hypothetical protein
MHNEIYHCNFTCQNFFFFIFVHQTRVVCFPRYWNFPRIFQGFETLIIFIILMEDVRFSMLIQYQSMRENILIIFHPTYHQFPIKYFIRKEWNIQHKYLWQFFRNQQFFFYIDLFHSNVRKFLYFLCVSEWINLCCGVLIFGIK